MTTTTKIIPFGPNQDNTPEQVLQVLSILARGESRNGGPPLPHPFESAARAVEAIDPTDRIGRCKVMAAVLGVYGKPSDDIMKAILARSPDAPPPPNARRNYYSADDLLSADLPASRFLVPDRISEGLIILAGRMKMGKSWLALLCALAVGRGGHFLGKLARKGKVAYFALEDPPKRLKKRMEALGWPPGASVEFFFNLEVLGGSLIGLPAFMEAGGYDLVIIDTLGRALPAGTKTRDTGEMTPILDPIQQSAVQQGRTVLVIDHYRKPPSIKSEGGDHLDEVMDSSAKVAVADTIIGLARKRGERGATLKITGRDLEEDLELAIEHDQLTGCWQLLGNADEVHQSARQKKLLQAFRRFGAEGYTANTKDLDEASGLGKGHTTEVLQELAELHLVEKLPRAGKEQLWKLVITGESWES
jgi:hypothetical protein